MAASRQRLVQHHGTMPPDTRPYVECKRRGCTGRCLAAVVQAGYQPGKERKQCRICGQHFQRPHASFGDFLAAAGQSRRRGRGGGSGDQTPSAAAAAAAAATREELKKVRKDNEELTRKLAAAAEDSTKAGTPPGASPGGAVAAGDGSKEDASRTARLQEINDDIRDLRAFSDDQRKRLGIDQQVRALEAERDAIHKARRETKPAKDRLAQAQAHERNLNAKDLKFDRATQELQARKAELDAELAANAEEKRQLGEQLHGIGVEISALLADMSKEKIDAAGCGRTKAECAADAVGEFFGDLAPLVASHPDGQARITAIKQMLNELLHASTAAAVQQPAAAQPASPAPPTTAGGERQPPPTPAAPQEPAAEDGDAAMVELDEEGLELFAELSVPELVEGGAPQDRQALVAAAKDRFRARGAEVARSLRKVRKGATK